MMHALLEFDVRLFYAINSAFHCALLDTLMMYVSEVKHFYLIYGLLIIFLYWKGGMRGKQAAFALVLSLVLTDQISAHLIKHWIERVRPCRALAGVVNLGGCGAGTSFPSAHAANLFGMAVVLASFFPRGKWWYFAYALLVCYSRVFIGVHYPLDILGGAALGSGAAWFVVIGVRRAARGTFAETIRQYLATFRRFMEWLVKRRYALPVFAGLLLGFAFPPSHLGVLAAVGLIPLLYALERDPARTRWQTFRLLYVAFFVFHAVANYWVGGWQKQTDPFLMIACVALMLVHPLFLSVPMYIYVWFRKRLGLGAALALLPFVWTAFEYLHSIGDLGYPWLTLGNTQTYYTEGIQFIEYTGAYGVSFLLLAQNAILFLLLLRLMGNARDFFRKEILQPLALLGVILIAPALHSEYVFRQHDTSHAAEKTFRAAVIQPNIDPWGKWGSVDTRSQMALLERLTRQTLPQQPDVIIWPETAVPFFITDPVNRAQLDRLRAFVDSCGVPLLTGFPDVDFYPAQSAAPPDAQRLADGEYVAEYNASMLMQPHTAQLQIYHKMQLVPFGERTPFVGAFPFLANLIRWSVGLSGWSKGSDYTVFTAAHGADTARIYGMICYESVYPSLVRQFTERGATLLAIITNDGWYGRSPGPIQHQQFAVLRAIENRRAIARCGNTGISCFIDEYGNVDRRTRWFTQAAIVGTLGLNAGKTFYTAYGDWLAWFCCGLSAAAGLFLIGGNLRRRLSAGRKK